MSVNERIKKVRDTFCNGDNSLFSEKIGTSKQYASNICNEGKNVGAKVLDKILNIFTEVNPIWLKLGEGSMLKDQSNVKFSGSYISENLIDVTHVTLKTYASFIESLYNCEPDLDTYKVMPEPGEDLNSEDYMVFDIEGDSMYPTIQSESKILCKKIDENQWEYARGVVVIVYGKTLTVKRILKNDLYINNNLTLKADNPTYGELNVERHEIRGIWQAVRVVSMKIA